MRSIRTLGLLMMVSFAEALTAAGWATLPPPDADGRVQIVLPPGGRLGRLELPWTGRPVGSAFLDGSPTRYVKWWSLSRSGHALDLSVVQLGAPTQPVRLTLELAEKSEQFSDGRWVFPVKQAAELPRRFREPRRFQWNFTATRPGTYFVEVAGQGWSEEGEAVELSVAGRTRPVLMRNIDSRRRWSVSQAGRMHVPAPGPQTLVAALGEHGHFLNGDLFAVTFRPAPEGARIYLPAGTFFIVPVAEAALRGRTLQASELGVDGWEDSGRASVAWQLEVAGRGDYQVAVEGSVCRDLSGSVASPTIRLGGRELGRVVAVPSNEVPGVLRWSALAPEVPKGEVELEVQPSSALVAAGFRLTAVRWEKR